MKWLGQYEEEIVVDPIILGEVRNGVLKLPHGRRRREIEAWFEIGVRRIVCLPWDASTAMIWADLLDKLRRAGREMAMKDSMIAATALVHRLTLVTRNERDFARAGVRILNPFE